MSNLINDFGMIAQPYKGSHIITFLYHNKIKFQMGLRLKCEQKIKKKNFQKKIQIFITKTKAETLKKKINKFSYATITIFVHVKIYKEGKNTNPHLEEIFATCKETKISIQKNLLPTISKKKNPPKKTRKMGKTYKQIFRR